MNDYAHKLYSPENSSFSSESQIHNENTQESITSQLSKSLIMSAISEPENGLIRHFYIETNDKGFISKLLIHDELGNSWTYQLDRLLEQEVTIAKVKGLDAVLMKVMTATGDESLIHVRYLSRAPSQYLSFEVRARKLKDGSWALFERDRPRSFKWMLFRSKNFMGITIGVDSYELCKDRPRV